MGGLASCDHLICQGAVHGVPRAPGPGQTREAESSVHTLGGAHSPWPACPAHAALSTASQHEAGLPVTASLKGSKYFPAASSQLPGF